MPIGVDKYRPLCGAVVVRALYHQRRIPLAHFRDDCFGDRPRFQDCGLYLDTGYPGLFGKLVDEFLLCGSDFSPTSFASFDRSQPA